MPLHSKQILVLFVWRRYWEIPETSVNISKLQWFVDFWDVWFTDFRDWPTFGSLTVRSVRDHSWWVMKLSWFSFQSIDYSLKEFHSTCKANYRQAVTLCANVGIPLFLSFSFPRWCIKFHLSRNKHANCICVVETDSGYLWLGNLRSADIIYLKNMAYTYVSAFLCMLHENNFSVRLESGVLPNGNPWIRVRRRNMLQYFSDFFDNLCKQNSNLESILKFI